MIAAGATVSACTLGLVGCSDSALPDSEEPALTTAAAPDSQDDGDSADSPETVVETVSEKPKDKQTENCAELPKDPREQYPSNSAPGRMPATDGSDFNFWIDDVENNYDPCAPVSWIIFRGALGDAEKPAGTGASITDGIAFYVNGKPDGEMRIFTKVENVSADDATVTLEWGARTEGTAAGITEHYSVELDTSTGSITPVSGNTAEFNERWNETQYMLGHE